jgi:2-polyprenyl-3-methyl-5-hydroxy-6-metoxy-1,4-benzoquinol methylase
LHKSFNGSILESSFGEKEFDLVYTMGVLIHIHPDDVLENMKRMFHYSSRYVLIGEYFNRTPVMIEYQGKRIDYLKVILANYFSKTFLYGSLTTVFCGDIFTIMLVLMILLTGCLRRTRWAR